VLREVWNIDEDCDIGEGEEEEEEEEEVGEEEEEEKEEDEEDEDEEGEEGEETRVMISSDAAFALTPSF
tara:strand:- start:761 stop:967 length:207 start_codon:yes stop_codon:yes gene_type:complete